MTISKEWERKEVLYNWEIEWRGVEYSGTLLVSDNDWDWDVDEDQNSEDLSDEEYVELLRFVRSEFSNEMLKE